MSSFDFGVDDSDGHHGMLSNPTMQARKLMDERGIRRASDDDGDEPYGSYGNSNGLGGMAPSEQSKRLASLENELADTKQLLMDVMYDKQALEREKSELQRLVEELSGTSEGGGRKGKGSGGGGGSENETVSQRATSTILALRLKRLEQKRSLFIDFVKNQGRTAGSAAKKVKQTLQSLKSDVQDQFTRMSEQLAESTAEFETIMDTINRRSYGLGDGVDDGTGAMVSSLEPASPLGGPASAPSGVFGMVAAAVQQQQRSIVLAADHPLIQRLTILYNTVDLLVEELNCNWKEMRCFSGGMPPHIARPRRYIDSLANVNNYIAQVAKMRQSVRYSHSVHRLFSDLRLPLAQRHGDALVAEADARLKQRVEAFFDAMRAVRTSVVVKQRNLTTAMRVFAACEAVQRDSTTIFTTYLKVSKAHALRILQHMARLIRFGRNRLADYAMIDAKGNAARVGDCTLCSAPVFCEDCFRIEATTSDVMKLSYKRHRRHVTDFSLARLDHYKRLIGLIDDAVKILTVARLVPLEATSGKAAADAQVDEMIRKPQAPSSINYFTRLRKSEVNQNAVARGQDPDRGSAGLAVAPPTLEEQRERLLEMLNQVDLHLLSPTAFPPDELQELRARRQVEAALGGAHDTSSYHQLLGSSTTAAAVLKTATLRPGTSTTVVLPAPPNSGIRSRRRPFTSSQTTQEGAAASESASRRHVEDHLPHLAGPRSAEAAAAHAERLDAMRRHHATLSFESLGGSIGGGGGSASHTARHRPPPAAGGGGPGSPRRYGSDVRRGFNVSKTARTLTDRVLGPDGRLDW